MPLVLRGAQSYNFNNSIHSFLFIPCLIFLLSQEPEKLSAGRSSLLNEIQRFNCQSYIEHVCQVSEDDINLSQYSQISAIIYHTFFETSFVAVLALIYFLYVYKRINHFPWLVFFCMHVGRNGSLHDVPVTPRKQQCPIEKNNLRIGECPKLLITLIAHIASP